jgi:hypothetical protein
MTTRPIPVTVVAWLFVVAGSVGLAYHAIEWRGGEAPDRYPVWVLVVRAAAVLAGLFLLRGANWARWLAVAWLSYHVVLGGLHCVSELVAHAVLLIAIGLVLWRRDACVFFASARSTG